MRLLHLANAAADRSAAGNIAAFGDFVSGLEVFSGSTLELGANSLWLVVFQEGGREAAADVKQ